MKVIKNCEVCKLEYVFTHGNQKFCKNCRLKKEKEWYKKWRKDNPNKIKQYNKKYSEKPGVKEKLKTLTKLYNEKYRLEHGETWSNKWQRENREKVNKNSRKRFKNRNKEEYKKRRSCRKKTYRLLKERNIDNQTCIVCDKKAVIHHNNYDNPFDIDWYCRYHHVKLHQLLKQPEFSK